jgi:prefoldin subunit 5
MQAAGAANMNMNVPYGHTAYGGSSHDLLNSLKPMLITMLMVKGNSDSGGGNFSQILWSMIAISMVDFIMQNAPHIIQFIQQYVRQKLKKTIENKLVMGGGANLLNIKREKTSSITIKAVMEDTNKNCVVYAVIDLLTNFPQTKYIILKNNEYQINYHDPIQIDTEIYAKLSGDKTEVDKSAGATTTTADQKPVDYIELYSYSLNMEELRAYVDKITRDYMLRIKNKLGNQIYFFNEMVLAVPYTHTGAVDYSKLSENLHFTMKPFYTNRKFSNIFGEEMEIIKKRVQFFKNNKKWYDEQGIPYTLGVLMSGIPGSGKTSTIKCLANELKRHIVNIHLTNEMSKTQLENLFFNDILHVTQNGKTDHYNIPIDQRIYVLEDVDCQCDFILERSDKSLDLTTKLKQKIDELTKTNEKLVQMIENPQQGKIMKMTQPDPHSNNANKYASQKITLSFLLNLLDGVLETPGRIIIMTTNWMEKLDYALIRPGRFDIKTDFGYCSNQMIVDIFNHRYEHQLTEENTQKILDIPEKFISPAELGKVLFENFDDMEQALHKLFELHQRFVEAASNDDEAANDTDLPDLCSSSLSTSSSSSKANPSSPQQPSLLSPPLPLVNTLVAVNQSDPSNMNNTKREHDDDIIQSNESNFEFNFQQAYPMKMDNSYILQSTRHNFQDAKILQSTGIEFQEYNTMAAEDDDQNEMGYLELGTQQYSNYE